MSEAFKWWLGPATLCGVCFLSIQPAQAQTAPTKSETTQLEHNIFTAVLDMCTKALDQEGPATPTVGLNALQTDLHDQCHAIAIAYLQGTATAQTLGTLIQVSGNATTTQGALSNRVVAGQFANISGRLDALRFGANAAIASGRVAATSSTSASDDRYAAAGPRSFYIDNTMLGMGGDSFVPSFAPPLGSAFQGTASDVAMLSGGRASTATGSDAGGSAPGASSGVSSPWGVFLQGSYNSGHHDLTTNEDPFDFHAVSVTGGVDYNFGAAVLGASVGYDDYDAGFKPGASVGGGSEHVAGTTGSLYGAWFGEHWTFNGIATYGRLTSFQSRVVDYTVQYSSAANQSIDPLNVDTCTGGTCTTGAHSTFYGDPAGRTLAVGATAGYQFDVDDWNITPSLSANYRHSVFDAFNEYTTDGSTTTNLVSPGDSLGLAYGEQISQSLRSILGVELSRAFSVPFGVLSPIVRGEWDHEFKTGVTSITAHYLNDPTVAPGYNPVATGVARCQSCFYIPSDAGVPNYAIVGGGLSVTLAHRVQAFIYDEVLVGYTDYHSNSVALGARAQF